MSRISLSKLRVTKMRMLALTLVVALALIVPALSMAQTKPKCTNCKAHFGCTTAIFGKDVTADGSVIMTHQEDYGDNDCMHIVYHPRQTHAPGEVIHFSYAEVPQVSVTYAWTADEMYNSERLGFPGPAAFMNGINEYGVCMSSNCFDSREPLLPLEGGLGWPEMGQLCMERCKTAREAVELSGWLIDNYHFNGFEATSCKYLTFLIADANEGWILEATPKHWAAKRCPDDGAILYANQAQIDTKWDLASADLIDYAVAQGWYDPASGTPFSFKEAYCGPYLGQTWNTIREWRQQEALLPKLGSITLEDAFAVWRDHYEGTEYYFVPHTAPWPIYTICAPWTHANEVYHLRSDMPTAMGCVMWIAASSPCTSVHIPVYAGNRGDTPAEWMKGLDTFDPNSAWWTFEQIQRVVADYDNTVANWEATWPKVKARWDQVERAEFSQTAELEKTTLKLWQRGYREMALKLLTRYTYTALHNSFLVARELLHWVELKAIA